MTAQPGSASRVVVIDNGGCSLKIGFAGDAEPLFVVPNLAAKAKGDKRLHLADEVEALRDQAQLSLRRPVDRGFVVNANLQRDLWERVLKRVLKVNPSECSLLVTEPLFNLPALQAALDDLVFSRFGFRYAVAAPAPVLAALDPRSGGEPGSQAAFTARAALVIDLGFSSTTVVSVFDARVQWAGVRRINLGGKALTNLLKELVSYRSMNVMDEFYLIEKIKERLCYVAPDAEAELASAQAPRLRAAIARDYVLPDGAQHARGFVRGEADDPRRAERAAHAARRPAANPSREEEDEEAAAAADPFSAEQALSLCNERFMVPEALLHPSGVGSPQAGLAEAALAAVSACGADIRPLLWSRVLLVGGGAALPGLRERLWSELRPLVPEDCELLLSAPPQPACSAWRGGSAWAAAEGGATFRWAAQGREAHAAAAAAGPRAHAETFVHHGSTGRPPAGRVW